MKPETADSLKERALARYGGDEADSAELVKFEDSRYGGQYVLVFSRDEVVGVYKVVARMGPAKAVPGGGGAVIVDSLSIGLKRIKRYPKGLVSP